MLHYFALRSHFIRDRLPFSLWYTLSFVIGILWQANYISTLSTVVIIIISSIALIPLQHMLYQKTIIMIMFLLGSWRYAAHMSNIQTALYQISEKSVNITAQVIDNNHHLAEPSTTASQCTLILRIISMQSVYHQSYIPAAGHLLQITSNNKDLANCHYGDIISIEKIWIKKPTPHTLHVLQRRNVIASSIIGEQKSINVQQVKMDPLWSYFYDLKYKIMRHINKKLSPLASYLFCSIFLGFAPPRNSSSSEVIRASFASWGISHYLARSGLHLALLVSATETALSIIPLAHVIKQIITACLLIIYSLLSWPSISFLRAGIMVLGNILCTCFKVSYQALHALMYTAILLLMYNPLYLMSLEFQLSFFITLGLAFARHATMIHQNNDV